MLNKGKINQKYVEGIIEAINKYGPYIILRDKFAIPHSKAGDNVKELSLSLLVLENPVLLKGEEVKTFLLLATKDTTSHMNILKELSDLLLDDEKYSILISGDVEKIEKILRIGE